MAQAASGARELNITQAEMDACDQYRCVYTDEMVRYGTVNMTPSTMMVNHIPGTTAKAMRFAYDSNGLCIQNKVEENSVATTYEYTLHGKLIAHLTKRTVVAGSGKTQIICTLSTTRKADRQK